MRVTEFAFHLPVASTATRSAAPEPALARSRDTLVLSRAAIAGQAPVPARPPVALPAAVPPLGQLDYYRVRAEDFRRRHPDLPVPSYYLGYGDKYVNRFTTELSPRLSPTGQEWLARARQNLQVAIEDRRRQDPVAFDLLERDDRAFLEFAYDSHPRSYLDAGLDRLPLKDLVRIGLTPDVRDLVSLNGLEQVADVAAGLAAKKARRYLDQGLTWKVPGGG